MRQRIENSVSRIWTRAELNVTVRQARENGFRVTRDEDMTEIRDILNNRIVLRALYNGQVEIVRFDETYFE